VKALSDKAPVLDYDRKKNPNAQPVLMGGVRVPFEPSNNLRWVKRGGVYVLQQQWTRRVSHGTLALKAAHGNATPTVGSVWMDVAQGEE
jgi:hypothetical protein